MKKCHEICIFRLKIENEEKNIKRVGAKREMAFSRYLSTR